MAPFVRETTGPEVVEALADQVKGKTILITGPSAASLGAETAKCLAKASPAELVLVGRSESKISPVIKEIAEINSAVKTRFVQCDLSSNASVRKAAEEIIASVSKIDILINSAGVMAIADYQKSVDGIEMQFAANHIGHFLLTNLLVSKLEKGSRIVTLTSTGFSLSDVREDWNFSEGKEYNPWRGYGQAKSANVHFTHSLATKLAGKGVSAYVVHPGFVPVSGIMTGVTQETFASAWDVAKEQEAKGEPPQGPMEAPKTLPQGCSTTLVAALDPAIDGKSGAFLKDCQVQPETELNGYLRSEENAERVWKLSEELVKERFAY